MPISPVNNSTSLENNDAESREQNQQGGEFPQNTQENKKKQKKKNGKHKSNQQLNVSAPCIGNRRLPRRNLTRSFSMIHFIPPTIPFATMRPFFPRYPSPGNYPVHINDWNSMVTNIQMQHQMFGMRYPPMPVPIYNPTQMIATSMCPYTGIMMPSPILGPMLAPAAVIQDISSTSNYVYESTMPVSPEQLVPAPETAVVPYQHYEGQICYTDPTFYDTQVQRSIQNIDPMDYYMSLPKHLFPSAKMIAIDPNPLIDNFCREANIGSHVPWILDLEFGLPRAPITRPTPLFDVRFNSIQCGNDPNLVHPGFHSCSLEFKQWFIYYYDSIITAWYKGYIEFHCDISLENFQEWMFLPTQVLGMCWP